MGKLAIRNYTQSDFDDLLRLCNTLDIHGQTMSAEDLRTALSLSKVVPEKDVYIVLEDTKPAGFGRIRRNIDGKLNRHYYMVFLPPDLQKNDEIVDELISVIENRLHEISEEYKDPLQIRTWCYEEEVLFTEAFERNGYRLNRHFARMDLNDISELKEPDIYEGVTIRKFDPETQSEKYVNAFNLSFKGHFEHQEYTIEEFEEYKGTQWFHPELMFAAVLKGEFIGISWNSLNTEPEKDGYIWGVVSELGVVPEWRGKGLGRALIRHGMLALREEGAERICLWVDYANPFGAKKLYYSEGFVDRYISSAYAKDEEG